MLGYNRTIARTNIKVLINIGPGAGGGGKRRGEKGNLPNTLTMIVGDYEINFKRLQNLSHLTFD